MNSISTKAFLALVGGCLGFSTAMAQQEPTAEQQDEKVQFSAGADLVSAYVWRGTHCAGISLQPSLGIGYKGLSLEAWGSSNFETTINEFDLCLAYETHGVSLALTDYFFPVNGFRLIDDHERGGFFEWDKDKTAHQLDLTLGFDFSELNERLPLSVEWNTIVAGDDLDDNGNRLYSSYFQLSYTLPVKDFDIEFATGFTPWEGMYQEDEKCNMVNLSIKGSYEIGLTDKFSLPAFAQLILNPNTENIYFVAGISF